MIAATLLSRMVHAAVRDALVDRYARKHAPGQKSLLSGEQLASDKTQSKFRWITIGGEPGEHGQHEGGTPVKIEQATGRIVAGPQALAAKGIKSLKDFGKSESERKQSGSTRNSGAATQASSGVDEKRQPASPMGANTGATGTTAKTPGRTDEDMKPGVPGQQKSLFHETTKGQLFNVVRPTTSAAPQTVDPSLLEKIADDQQAAKHESLPGQKDLLSDKPASRPTASVDPYQVALAEAQQHIAQADMSSAASEELAMRRVVEVARQHGVSANELWREVTWSSSPRDIESEVSGEADERAAERGSGLQSGDWDAKLKKLQKRIGKPVPKVKVASDSSPLTSEKLFERTGQGFENLQIAMGVKKPAKGEKGAQNIRDFVSSHPGGRVIAAVLGVDGSQSGYDRNGFPERAQDAFREVIDGKFTKPELDAASKWFEDTYNNSKGDLASVNQYRWIAGTIKTSQPTAAANQQDAEVGTPASSGQAGASGGSSSSAPALAAREAVVKDIADKVAKKLVEDFGEHIPGARKELSAGKTPSPKKPKSDDERPAWARRYQVSQIAKSSRASEDGKWSIGDTKQKDRWTGGAKKATDQLFDSKEDAEAAIPLLEVSRNHRVIQTAKGEPVDPAAYEQWMSDMDEWKRQLNSSGGAIKTPQPKRPPFKGEQWAIHRDVSDRKHPMVKGGFASRDEAMRHMAEHALDHFVHRIAGLADGHGISEPNYKAKTRPEVKAAAKELIDAMMGKSETTAVTARKRADVDEVEAMKAQILRRHPDMKWDENARNTFRVASPSTIAGHMHNLRVGLHEMANRRKKTLNKADLAEFDALSKRIADGDYGPKMDVETKGGGRFSLGRSTYENLEKLNQLHAKMVGRGFHTKEEHSEGNKVRRAIDTKLFDDSRAQAAAEGATETRRVHSDFLRDARKLDEYSSGDYYALNHEMFARAFESYVDDKLKDAGRRSDYLIGQGSTNAAKYRALMGASPFPEGEERTRINAAFDKLFGVMRGHELPAAKRHDEAPNSVGPHEVSIKQPQAAAIHPRFGEEARRKESGNRDAGFDWTVRGADIEAHHAITGRSFGTINLDTGDIVGHQPGDEAKLREVRDAINRRAERHEMQSELDRLRDYPAKNAEQIKKIERQLATKDLYSRIHSAVERYAIEHAMKERYSKDQPRVPAGSRQGGQFAAMGTRFDANTASELVGQLRDGEESSKNRGIPSRRLTTGELVMSEVPTSFFDDHPDEDYGNVTGFIRATTDPTRVNAYRQLQASDLPPIYIATNRRGKHVLSDGGHRLMAAIDRGDKKIRALVSPELHHQLHGATATAKYSRAFDESQVNRNEKGEFASKDSDRQTASGATNEIQREKKGRQITVTRYSLAGKPDVEVAEVNGEPPEDALKFGKQQRGAWINVDTGLKIDFFSDGVSDSIAKESCDWRAFKAVPDLVKNAVRFATEPYVGKKTGFTQTHFFYAPLHINGEPHIAKLTVHAGPGAKPHMDAMRLYNLRTENENRLVARAADEVTKAASVSAANKPAPLSIDRLAALVKQFQQEHVHPEQSDKYSRAADSFRDQVRFAVRAACVERYSVVDAPYGFCPTCGAKGVQRERRLNGNDRCYNGHEYPSSSSTKHSDPKAAERYERPAVDPYSEDYPSERRSLRDRIASAASQTDRNPSDEQKKAGNYRKGKFWLWGHEVAIENPKGSTRSGQDASGKAWSVTMGAHYGYIRRTLSKADGDAVDCFIGPHPESEAVFVVNQCKPSGKFDEHKCVLGCRSVSEAKALYLSCYSSGWQGIGSIVPMTKPQFLKWLERGDTTRAVKFNDSIERYAKDANGMEHKGKGSGGGQFTSTSGASEAHDDTNAQSQKRESALRDSAPSRELSSADRFWNSTPVAIKGDEIATLQEPLEMTRLRQSARTWADQHLPQDVTNEATGWKLIVHKKGVSDALAHGSGPQKIQAVAAIPSLLKQASLLTSSPNRHGKPLTDHIFAAQLKIAEEVFVVGMVVHEDTNGRRFYDHELMEMKNLDQVLSQVGAASQGEVGRPVPSRGSINKIVARWLQVNPKPKDTSKKSPNKVERYDRQADLASKLERMGLKATPAMVKGFADALEKRAFKERGEELPEHLKRTLPDVPQPTVSVPAKSQSKQAASKPKRQPGDGTAGWQKVGGSSVFVNGEGKITKGCPGLKGEHVSDLIDESDESRKRREVRQDHALAQGKTGAHFTPSQLKKLETGRPRERHEAAQAAAKRIGVPTHRVLAHMPEIEKAARKTKTDRMTAAETIGHSLTGIGKEQLGAALRAVHDQFEMEHGTAQEIAKAHRVAMQMTGLTPAKIRKIEEAHRDYSTVPHFDEGAYDFANELNSPFIHFDKNAPDIEQQVWDFIRDGKPQQPSLSTLAMNAADQVTRNVARNLQSQGIEITGADDWGEDSFHDRQEAGIDEVELEHLQATDEDAPFDKFSRRAGLLTAQRSA